MEPPKADPLKLPDMVMCGDHPSITKTELNVKEDRPEDKPLLEKDKSKDRPLVSHAKISPTSSRTERSERASSADQKSRNLSEHALRMVEARRHARSLEVVSRHEDISATGNRALVQAALGSFRWPPYLVAVWVVVLLLTHILHCLVTMLERALPALKKFALYCRAWTEESWKSESEPNHRVVPVALGLLTGLLYAVYCGLYALYAVALWSVEPIAPEDDRREDVETRITNYVDEVNSKMNSSLNN